MWQTEIVTGKRKYDVNQHLENEQKLEMGKKAAFWTKQQKTWRWLFLLVIQMGKEAESQEKCACG